jgi:hypothetical protein
MTGFLVLCCFAVWPELPPIEVHLPQDHLGQAFCTAEEAAQLRERLMVHPAAADNLARQIKQAQPLMTRPLTPPAAEGGSLAAYYCAADNQHLAPEPGGGHRCRRCGKVYSGEQYDRAHISWQHQFWLRGIEILGWLYTLTNDTAYAARAREILLAYADVCEQFSQAHPRADEGATRLRFLPQSLDEAYLLTALSVGYDRVAMSPPFRPEERQRIESLLIRPLLEAQRREDAGRSNWQSWHNAAIACAGLVLGDTTAVNAALNGPSGFLFQMREGVLDSGLWHEIALHYHFFALRAHIYLLEGLARCGVNLYELPMVPKLFDAPYRWPYPDGTLPALGDSDREPLSNYRELYEVGYRRIGRFYYLHALLPRDTLWGLVWGAATLPQGNWPDPPSVRTSNNAAEGVAILRNPARGIAAYLDYGTHTGSHTHPARLNLLLYAQDGERLVDRGRIAYAHPMYRSWYTQTLAHNACIVESRSQKPCAGKPVFFCKHEDFAMVRARANDCYGDVRLDRTVLLMDDMLIDIMQGHAGQELDYDLPFHLDGTWEDLPQTEPVVTMGAGYGYEHLEDMRRLPAEVKSLALRTGDNARMRIHLLGDSVNLIGTAPGRTPAERMPLLLRRQYARSAIFITAIDCAPDPTPHTDIHATTDGRIVVQWRNNRLDLWEQTYIIHQGRRFRVDTGTAQELTLEGTPVEKSPAERAREMQREIELKKLPPALREKMRQ